MTARRLTAVLVAVLALPASTAGAQDAGSATTRVAALIGLARTARDQGRYDEAARHFKSARQDQAFDTPLLVEYFWVAQRADAKEARNLGRQILRLTPNDAAVRDGLIGVLAAERAENDILSVARAGVSLDPRSALWPRRLAESLLRSGQGLRAAEYFQKAATLRGGDDTDRAMAALALESTGDKTAAARAWSLIDESVWSRRSEWTESRARALAATSPTTVTRARPAPPAVASSAREHSYHADDRTGHVPVATDPCTDHQLVELEHGADVDPFIDAVASRPLSCADHQMWIERAGERAIALGRFADALRVVRPAATTDDAPLTLKAQHAVLLHWTGDDMEAEPLLREVVAHASAPDRAIEALVDVLRSSGRPDEAWSLAQNHWNQTNSTPGRQLVLASLALETGRPAEALAVARALEDGSAVGRQARSIDAAALLATGHPLEAKAVLGTLLPRPFEALTWLDAVAVTEGISAALESAEAVVGFADRSWMEVMARRAVWFAQTGEADASKRLLESVESLDPGRGSLARAEVDLATGRPSDAVDRLQQLSLDPSLAFRAKDLLSTALAEQGEWDGAFALLAELRSRRPHEVRLGVREAAWRNRRSPSAETLTDLQTVVSAAPEVAEGPILLARALVRAGRYPDAWPLLTNRSPSSVEARLLRAEVAATTSGVAAADAEFESLTSGRYADRTWYLAWADLHGRGPGLQQILEKGTQRFPVDPLLQERLAVAAWAAGDRATALQSADAALATDQSRTGAWFVKIADTDGRPTETLALISRFEEQFSNSPTALLAMGDMLSALVRTPEDPAARKALEWASRIRAERPALDAAIVTEVRLLASLGEYSRAMDEIDALVRAQASPPEARKLRAELLAGTGHYAEAIEAYDGYLALAPHDLTARRQQARIEGWRGATASSLVRYADLVASASEVPAVKAEAAAKREYYQGHWREALVHYDAWLALEPEDPEAQLERAQALDHLGMTALAVEGYRGLSPEHRVATLAASRIERRRAPSVDFFSVGSSANGVSRQQVLDVLDTGAGFSTGIGSGYATRARLFGGRSLADAGDRFWQGQHAGAEIVTTAGPSLGLGGRFVYRKLNGVRAQLLGDAHVDWTGLNKLRLSVGAERSVVLENASTITSELTGIGPTAGLGWRPNDAFSIEVTAKRLSLSDANTHDLERADLSQRLWGRSHEFRLIASSEYTSYAESRDTYFTPGRFWRHDAGVEWRGWLATPRFFGDRERWVSAAYLFGVDNRSERYDTARLGLAYEFGSGVGVVVDGFLVRSRVYDGARVSIGLRLKHVPIPAR